MRIRKYPLMNEAGADAGGGAPADAAPAAAPVLAAGADGGAAATPWDSIPEKYRVTKEDGSPDMDATVLKAMDGYQHLSKRLGSGDTPPKEAAEYKLNIPEAYKDKLDAEAMAGSEQFVAMRDRWHKAGFTQAQFDVATADFFDTALEVGRTLAGDAAPMTAEDCTVELRKTWKTDVEFKAGVRDAYRAASSVLGDEGTKDFIAKHGNDPQILMLLAGFGREMQEDRPANSGTQAPVDSVETLMASEAYRNPKHPEHKAVSERVKRHFERKFGT